MAEGQQQGQQGQQGEEGQNRQDQLGGVSRNDAGALDMLMRIRIENEEESGLDRKVHALVNIGALVALDADPASFVWQIDRAVDAGASPDEVIGVLVALAPMVGVARIVSAAPNVAAALDIELTAGEGGGGDGGGGRAGDGGGSAGEGGGSGGGSGG